MNYNFLKIDNIIIDKNYNISYLNSKKENKPLVIKTPLLYLPFGVDKEFNNYYLKGQLRKSKDSTHNLNIISFLKFIQNLETLFSNKLNKEIKSQIINHPKYDPVIIFKIIKIKDKIITEIKNENKNYNFFKINKGIYFSGNIIIDKLWIYEEKIFYKIKLKNIDLSV